MGEDKEALDFAGFTDIGVVPQTKGTPLESEEESSEPKTNQTSPRRTEEQAASPRKKRPSVATWFWVVVVGVVLVVLFNMGQDDGRGSEKRSSHSPGSAPSTSSQANRSIEFVKPPVGTNTVLGVAQIRWCLREDIRIEARRPRANTNQELIAFNSTVADYNRRCASFRYEIGAMERAKREVAGMRLQIVAAALEGSRTAPSVAVSPPSPRTAVPASMRGQDGTQSGSTREVQNLLKQLGYNPGAADGIYGPRTRAAIQAFQRDRGMLMDGEISLSLRIRLIEDARRGCEHKRIMTDADYRRCGIRPPSS